MLFKETIISQKLVLDGALGTQLEETIPRDSPLSVKGLPLWSTKVLIHEPQLITEIHKQYLEKGASVLITSLYQASLQTLQKHENMTVEQVQDVWLKSIECATEAIAAVPHDSKVFIAASVGPYGAYLANGAEYSGEYGNKTVDELADYHRHMVNFFTTSADVDCIAFETIPTFGEIKAIFKLVGEVFTEKHFTDFWVTLSCKDAHTLADGTPLEEVFAYLLAQTSKNDLASEKFVGTGCNCVPLEYVTDFITKANEVASSHNLQPINLIVYPNHGFENDMSDVSQYKFRKFSEKWIREVEDWSRIENVRVIGGCCSTGPEEVGHIHRIIKPSEH